jgi:hypothetical protein
MLTLMDIARRMRPQADDAFIDRMCVDWYGKADWAIAGSKTKNAVREGMRSALTAALNPEDRSDG